QYRSHRRPPAAANPFSNDVIRITMECKGTHQMTERTILRTDHERVTVLSFNRPDRLNAVSENLYRTLHMTLTELDSDPHVRAVVLTGSGRAFCAGADLKAHDQGTRTDRDREEYVRLAQQVCLNVQTMST